jgi:hypothetical protein
MTALHLSSWYQSEQQWLSACSGKQHPGKQHVLHSCVCHAAALMSSCEDACVHQCSQFFMVRGGTCMQPASTHILSILCRSHIMLMLCVAICTCSSQQFIANMSVGDTLLRSSVISFSASPDQPSNNPLSQQPQQQLLTAATELLCTGEVEDVRGESGQFPANLTAQQGGDKTAIYHPRGELRLGCSMSELWALEGLTTGP